MSVTSQVDRIDGPQGPRRIAADGVRAKVLELAGRSGIRDGGPRERYVRLLMHYGGLTNSRGHRFQYEAPPKALTPLDAAAIETAAKRDLDELATYLLPPTSSPSTPPPADRPPRDPLPGQANRGRSWSEA